MSIAKDHSLFRDPVNIRSGNLRFRVQGRDIPKALVIGHDVNNVGLLRGGRLEPVHTGSLTHDDYQAHNDRSG